MLFELRGYFYRSALISIACGIIGTLVVVNRIVFISGGIAHAAYGGIGLGYFFGFNPVLGAIALTVVMVMQVVGLIMVIALLTIPAAIAGQFVKDIKQMMLYSSYLGIIFTTVGLWLSYSWDLTSGATIILVSGTTYLGTLVFKAFSKRLLN